MTLRLAVAALAIVLTAMAYPWQTTVDWWILGVGAAVVIVALAWWRGQFLTTMVARWFALWRRNRGRLPAPNPEQTTVVLRVDDPAGRGVALAVLAGYVERFGLRSEKVRVTNRASAGVSDTWVSLTLDARTNLSALQARSKDLPLHDTAAIAARRLADHLRETGLDATIVDSVPAPLEGWERETWRGVHDERGFISVYALAVDERLGERLAQAWSDLAETWTAIEFSGTATRPTVAAVCAVRTPEPGGDAPLPGLIDQRGAQGPLLTALDPAATGRLGVPGAPLRAELLDTLGWPAGTAAQVSRT
ncbi:type VII secretion protein EccE [Mycolicibacterium flavescens]|uniref:Type VII secretion protein EccE n=1 Tax=Mycolicibacterium flavescens TaxID=1776 RepID=A0A1E3RNV4_MYCFV|nr:type VII secretion protein EccE [Mycolicibacterium flavescens]MCV7281515.1 type VII secretion protein EccE [Mycolicibacterium flavescens]ODQ91565.1 type VII secretion protein EccE [Mycolicibacterium flavescens]